MGAQNKFSGKAKEGLFANGQGPVKGQSVVREGESSGVLNKATEGRHLKAQGGKSEELAATPKDKNFDLHSKSYAGPGNLEFKPKDMGDVTPGR